ncbi:hypothetical protein GGI07_004440 [Coemansia sp. Benny D115]|nr:hypothetical protein GGI07_004440 [Coemansia sp. Benny D115]
MSAAMLRGRANGSVSAAAVQRCASAAVLATLRLAETRRFAHVHTAPVHCLALEKTAGRLLLSAGADTSIQMYDLDGAQETGPHSTRQIAPVHRVAAGAGHTRLVSSAEWYCVDAGMFSTGSFDGTVRVWDAGAMVEACRFDMEARVYSQHMSATGIHTLIAVADESAHIRLCDLTAGSFAQSIFADEGGNTAVAWSPTSPFLLATGGRSGSVRLWDIRRPDTQLHSLKSNITGPRRAASSTAVGGMLFTGDGSCVLSVGQDRRMRVWSVDNVDYAPWAEEVSTPHCHHHYAADTRGDRATHSATPAAALAAAAAAPPLLGPVNMAVTSATDATTLGSDVLFVPNGDTTVAAVDAASGRRLALLDGHFGPTTCAVWRASSLELFTSGADADILVWRPPALEQLSEAQQALQTDCWSDDCE